MKTNRPACGRASVRARGPLSMEAWMRNLMQRLAAAARQPVGDAESVQLGARAGALAAGLAFVGALATAVPDARVVGGAMAAVSAVSAAVPDVPARFVGLADPEKVAKVVAEGPYPGFDTNIYP